MRKAGLLVVIAGLIGMLWAGCARSPSSAPEGKGAALPALEGEGWINGPLPDTTSKVVVIDAWAYW